MLTAIFSLKLRFATVIFFLWVALSLQALPYIAAAQCSPDNVYNPDRVRWSKLSFKGKTFLGRISVDVQLTFVSSDLAQRALITSPKGVPVSFESAKVGQIAVNRTIRTIFGSDIVEEDKVLFKPTQAGALGRIRLRRGKDDFLKRYRFTNLGVFRIQKEPADKKEAQLPPDEWSDGPDRFYTHDLRQLGCSIASERSILLYVACAAPFSKNQPALSVCVFGKRQLHRVQISAGDIQALKVNYIEKRQEAEVAKEGSVDALKITFKTQALASDLGIEENFSFLGLR